MLRTLIAATLILALPVAGVAADVTGQQMIEGKDRDAVKVYAKGVLAANTYLTHIRQKEMFCMPPGLALTPEQYISAIEELLKRRPHAASEPAPVVMAIALINMFRCK